MGHLVSGWVVGMAIVGWQILGDLLDQNVVDCAIPNGDCLLDWSRIHLKRST